MYVPHKANRGKMTVHYWIGTKLGRNIFACKEPETLRNSGYADVISVNCAKCKLTQEYSTACIQYDTINSESYEERLTAWCQYVHKHRGSGADLTMDLSKDPPK